ncbi:MAG: hypothetical protein ACUVQT_00745 [bacterium]
MKLTYLILALVISYSTIFCHPPSAISIKFDSEQKLLSINLSHPVSDVQKHFINKIVNKLNGHQIIEQRFGMQEDRGAQIADYRIFEANEGDTLLVTGFCSIIGKKTEKFIIGKIQK